MPDSDPFARIWDPAEAALREHKAWLDRQKSCFEPPRLPAGAAALLRDEHLHRGLFDLLRATETETLGCVRAQYLSNAARALADAWRHTPMDTRVGDLSRRASILAEDAPLVLDSEIHRLADAVRAVKAEIETERRAAA